jgi:hypothetical protein
MTTHSPTDRGEKVKAETLEDVGARRALPAAARRALEEAEQRRRDAASPEPPREIGGRGGRDPARYGDWEVKGLASDF